MADVPSLKINPNAAREPGIIQLPTPQVATLRQGEVQVTTPQIAQLPSPLRELSASLSKVSDETNQVAQLFAKQEGYKAVTRDDDGNLVVTQAPYVGDAAVAFHSAVKFAALSQAEAEAKREDLVMSRQYHQDPDGYLQASKAFRDKHVAEYGQKFGADVGAMLGRSIDTNVTQNYRWLVLEQQRNIKHNFDQGTQAAIASTSEDLISFIKTGGDVDSPTGKALVDKAYSLNKMRVTNPVLAESPDVAARRIKLLDLQVGAAKYVQGLNRILQDPAGGITAAQQALESHLKEKGDPTQKALDYAEGQKAIKDHITNLQRDLHLRNTARKIRDEEKEDAIIKDSASGNPQITENDIKTDPEMSAEAKMRMLAWQKRDGMPEPMARVSQTNATDLFRRMALPEDDPNRITDLRPIRDAYVQGKLTRADEDWLERKFKEGQSPDGSNLQKQKERVIKASALDKSSLMSKDELGPMAEYKFREYVDQRIDQYRKEGKDPYDLLNPSKPDFIGKPEVIQYFRSTVEEQAEAVKRKFQNRPPAPAGLTPPGAAAPTGGPTTRRQGESINDFMKRTGQKVP